MALLCPHSGPSPCGTAVCTLLSQHASHLFSRLYSYVQQLRVMHRTYGAGGLVSDFAHKHLHLPSQTI